MTRDEFIEILKEGGYSYKIKGDKIIVTYGGVVYLNSLKTLPPGVEFKNGGYVSLDSLKTLPPGVVFRNEDSIYLNSLETISPGVVFNNGVNVSLGPLETIPPGVEFRNVGHVYLGSLGVWFYKWYGNIEGIDNKRLLNYMISKGMFI